MRYFFKKRRLSAGRNDFPSARFRRDWLWPRPWGINLQQTLLGLLWNLNCYWLIFHTYKFCPVPGGSCWATKVSNFSVSFLSWIKLQPCWCFESTRIKHGNTTEQVLPTNISSIPTRCWNYIRQKTPKRSSSWDFARLLLPFIISMDWGTRNRCWCFLLKQNLVASHYLRPAPQYRGRSKAHTWLESFISGLQRRTSLDLQPQDYML